MIAIKMHEGLWRIIIGDEIWEFKTLAIMNVALQKVLMIKDSFGRIKKYDTNTKLCC